jgi:hypothetical protein
MELMVNRFQQRLLSLQTLYIDSKPRFRAEWELDGVSTKVSRRYKKWAKDYGTFIPGSYVLPLRDPARELDQVWRLGGKIAIAQGEIDAWPKLIKSAEALYNDSYGKRERMLYVNELSDFFQTGKPSDIFWLIARSGGEKKISLAAESQRPVYIPKTVLTESVQIFLFKLKYSEDMKRMYEMGIPKDTPAITKRHVFYHWDTLLMNKAPSGRFYTLSL